LVFLLVEFILFLLVRFIWKSLYWILEFPITD
jgi:hypothetical protein